MAYDEDDDDRAAKALLAEPCVQETIERSLETFRAILPPAMLQAMRETLEEALTTDPYAVALIQQLKERSAPKVSGEAVREDAGANGCSHDRANGSANGGREGA